MQNLGIPSKYGLEKLGITHLKSVYWNLFPPTLVEELVRRNEGILANQGAVVVKTGVHTGRSPNDKFIAKNGTSSDDEIWWGKVNQSIPAEKFDQIQGKMIAYLQGRDVFVKDVIAGAHPKYQVPIRIISEKAWAGLFSHDLFLRIPSDKLSEQSPQYTFLHCPDFQANPAEDGTRTGTFVGINFEKKVILVCGSCYAGEVKKSVFTLMNYLMPRQGILSMHCSANVGEKGDVALFFGLSGTGKTTLSSDPERSLIGDDEHGWSDEGIFNFEGGCYAKTIRLNPTLEPLIWQAAHRFGAVLENVVYHPDTRRLDFDDASLTENTRAAYPIDFIENHVVEGYAGHPENIFFLSADAFGVLPPLSRLTPEQAMYYFLSGYTSKLAGTEKGLGAEPEATFSTAFGAPFLPLHPRVYAKLLGEKIKRHKVQVWLINTGWTGGQYGVGHRTPLPHTRAMIRAALTHALENITMRQDPYFGLWIPESCPGVPNEMLNPQQTWQDAGEYQTQAQKLIALFIKNFEQFTNEVPADVVEAGPHLAQQVA